MCDKFYNTVNLCLQCCILMLDHRAETGTLLGSGPINGDQHTASFDGSTRSGGGEDWRTKSDTAGPGNRGD